MEREIDDLLHFGDFAFLEDASPTAFSLTAQSALAEDDMVLSRAVPPTKMQEWCLERIAQHRTYISDLRDVYGPAAHNAILETKSHIRALRCEYNGWAPINRRLPPEVLMEVFANVHPAMTPQRRVPILRVCRYWRRLVLKTPQFWANILSLQILYSKNPDWRRNRLMAALSLSTSRSLTLNLPPWSLDVVGALLPHASRIASLNVHSNLALDSTQQLLEQHLSRLKDLAIFNCSIWHDPLTLYFDHYPNIRSLQLNLTRFYSPVVSSASLHHLELTRCLIDTRHTTGNLTSLYAVHDALELFPNLETLSLTYSLSEPWFDNGDSPTELTKTISLPRLRHVEIEDIPVYIPQFLSHIVFPPTTALVLRPSCGSAVETPVTVPVFPGINPAPDADAEITLYLDFSYYAHSPCSKGLARWETQGKGTRPVRVTLPCAGRVLEPITHFTRELVRALAPPPARGMTALTATGTWARVAAPHSSAREYWVAFLPELPGLRRLVCTMSGTTRDLLDVLGRPLPGRGEAHSEFLCPGLAELALMWDLQGLLAEGEHRDGVRGTRQSAGLSCEVVVGLRKLCDTLEACLGARAGRCEPIQKVSVVLRGPVYDWSTGTDSDVQGRDTASLQRHLRDGLGDLVGEVFVVDKLD